MQEISVFRENIFSINENRTKIVPDVTSDGWKNYSF